MCIRCLGLDRWGWRDQDPERMTNGSRDRAGADADGHKLRCQLVGVTTTGGLVPWGRVAPRGANDHQTERVEGISRESSSCASSMRPGDLPPNSP